LILLRILLDKVQNCSGFKCFGKLTQFISKGLKTLIHLLQLLRGWWNQGAGERFILNLQNGIDTILGEAIVGGKVGEFEVRRNWGAVNGIALPAAATGVSGF
jgi:hypothetical protein